MNCVSILMIVFILDLLGRSNPNRVTIRSFILFTNERVASQTKEGLALDLYGGREQLYTVSINSDTLLH